MPVYEYVCHTCQTRYDKLRPIREADAPATCPTCNEQNSERALSTFAVHTSSGGSAEARTVSTGSRSCGGGSCSGCRGCASSN
jgi:putative FmdB family regulatory protein